LLQQFDFKTFLYFWPFIANQTIDVKKKINVIYFFYLIFNYYLLYLMSIKYKT